MLRATAPCTFSISQLPKVVRTSCVLYILTWKCASRHNGVRFFDISTSTSKSVPRMVCFDTFYFQMCFLPQRRALFSTSQLQLRKVLEEWCVLTLFTCKCDWRHNGVHVFNISTSKSGPKLRCFVHFDFQMYFAPQWRAFFLLSHLASWLRTLASLLFDPPEPQIIGKNTVFRDFPTFSRTCIFSLLTFSISYLLTSDCLPV